MLKTLLQKFAGSRSKSPAGRSMQRPANASVLGLSAQAQLAGVPIYPPVDNGIASVSAQLVLATQANLIKRLKILTGCRDPEFDDLYGEVLHSLANYVGLLPASQSGTHMGAGGLFRLAIELGFFVRQGCEGVLFAGRAGVEMRRDLEPRWRYATFLAGLCCELYRPLSRMIVVTGDGKEWPLHRQPLAEWLESVGAERYFVRWVPEGNSFAGGSASFIATKIIPEKALQYLQEGHPDIIPCMLDAIVSEGARTKENKIADLIDKIRRKVLERDQILAPQNYGKLTVGAHLEPHLLDVMRQLVGSGVWQINQKKSRLWYGKDGLFLVWRTAAKEMVEVLEKDSMNGIPRDATTLAEVLLKAGVFAPDNKGDVYWKIKPPLSENTMVAVRLTNPATLLVALEDETPDPVDVYLDAGRDAKAAPAAVPTVTPPAAPVPPPAAPMTPPAAAPEVPSRASTPDLVNQETPAETSEVPPAETPERPKVPAKSKSADTPAAPKKSPAKEMSPGAIAPVQEKPRDVMVTIPDDVAARMSALSRAVVNKVVKDYRSGALQLVSAQNEQGLAIAIEQLSSYGIELTTLLGELHGLGWLYVDPAKPGRKIHMAKIGDRLVQSAIFKEQVAIDLGFIV